MLYFRPTYRTQFFILIFCLLLGITACKKSSNNVTGPDPGTDPDPTEEPDSNLLEITSIDPESGIIGIEVIISGKNFSATASENTVTFGGVEATVSTASEDELIAEVPEGASSGPVEVTVNGNKATGPDFTVMSPEELPEITSVDPLSGTVGTQVTITGVNFSATSSENTITFGGTEADITSASETELVTEVPDGANSGPVEVTVNGVTATGPDFEVTISNLIGAIDSDAALNRLSELIKNSDLLSILEGEGPYTILAPTDAAFDELDPSFLNNLTPDELEDILSYHVIADDLEPDDFTVYGAAIETIQGESVHTTTEGPRVLINNDATLGTNRSAPNGKIYKVDKLLLPDAFLDVFEVTYKRYVTNKFACSCVSGRTGIQDELQNVNIQFTLFAPSNTAFFNRSVSVDSLSDAELRDLMNYHIVENQSLTASDLTNGQALTTRNGQDITIAVAEDGTVTINGAAVIETIDLVGTNGVVHVIDTVLEPPLN